MEELNIFIKFLLDHRSDDRIRIHKKMKYGFRHFYIEFNNDVVDNNLKKYLQPSVTIIFDNRNKCIEVNSFNKDYPITIEDEKMTNEWSDIINQLLESEIKGEIKDIIDESLKSCENKNLHREYIMKKIMKDDTI